MADYDLMTGVKKAYEAYSPTNKPTTADVTGLDEALKNAGGSPVLSTAWVQLRTAMWDGYVAADGQLLKRADYPDAWKAIEAGKVPVVSDADWLAAPLKRGSFTDGDGSTTFRIPDYNGKSVGSLGAAFQRGDGLNSTGFHGTIQGDAIRNIAGSFGFHGYQVNGTGGTVLQSTTGVFKVSDAQSQFAAPPISGGSVSYGGAVFDASTVVPTGNDNHPVNVTGCWAIKLFGSVQNSGEIDAMGLATQVANLDSNKLDKASVVAPMANCGVIERGSNANGRYTKFMDGTLVVDNSGAAVVTNPVTFVGAVTSVDSNKLRFGYWK